MIGSAFGCAFFGGCTVAEPSLPEVAPIPFVVSDYFSPTGYFGDPDALVVDINEGCAERPEGAEGNCYRVRYEPTLCDADDTDCDDTGVDEWAGVFFQYPLGNWGKELGREVEAGATRVSFYAAVVPSPEADPSTGRPSFLAGSAAGVDPITEEPFPYFDQFSCTTMNGCIAPDAFDGVDGVMRRYEIELPWPNYVPIDDDGNEVGNSGRVYGPFGFSISAPREQVDTSVPPAERVVRYSSVTLYLDDIRWE